MEVVVTAGAITRARLETNHQFITTNKPTPNFLQAGCPCCLSPNQQCQSTEGLISHSMDLFTASSPGVFQLWFLTTEGCWLPWGGLPCLSSGL